ncbi:MAG: hypothetical protein R2816_10385 [Flavobacteriaceae bacterium]|nr:hypothetical protein [Flavobacteriaceae bacterium]
MQKKLVVICLINFFIAAMMGLALRYSFISSINLNYRYLTHAHSHVAMLGWVYLMLFVLIVHYFVPEKKPVYNRLFWLTEFSVVGMMVSFPFQGYAVISITFSTLHILCSYYFAYLIWKHHKTKSIVTSKLLKASLLFMLLSTIGVWCLGPAVSMLGQASAFYQIAIQFFLHFQFNGWFLIAVITVFFHILGINNSKEFKLFFNFLIASTILTLALPIQWFAPHETLLWVNGIGVILQLFTLFFFLKIIKTKLLEVIKHHTKLIVYLISFSILCFLIKILLQVITLIPEFSEAVYTHRNFVIGFIHLLMLGVISGFLLSFIAKSNLVSYSKSLYIGIYSFILGFVLTELLLLIQGYKFYYGNGMISNYYLLLFIFSVFLPLGIFLLLFNIIKNSNHEAQTTKTS